MCVFALITVSCAKARFIDVNESEQTTSHEGPLLNRVTATEVVAAGNKQVDFLLVLDDSNSMLPELRKLSSRMTTFVSFLEASQIDWQMCVTTTRPSQAGTSLNWKNYRPERGESQKVLKRGTPGLHSIFTSTINSVTIGGGDSGDERALKAVYESFAQGGPCYRPGAAVSVIAISDEDERSVGGEMSLLKPQDAAAAYQPLEKEDVPINVLGQAQATFGAHVRFTFNSIIVKPGDKVCEAKQDENASPSHPGHVYAIMSEITDGGIGSICDADYSGNLNTFKDKIVNSLSKLTLQCEPVEGTLSVLINSQPVKDFRIDRNILRFKGELLEGTRIDLSYDCEE